MSEAIFSESQEATPTFHLNNTSDGGEQQPSVSEANWIISILSCSTIISLHDRNISTANAHEAGQSAFRNNHTLFFSNSDLRPSLKQTIFPDGPISHFRLHLTRFIVGPLTWMGLESSASLVKAKFIYVARLKTANIDQTPEDIKSECIKS